MSGIYGFLTAFCATSAVFGALYILMPDGSFNKPLKYTFCIVFLCIVLSSFALKLKSVNTISFSDYSYEVSDVSEKTAELTFKTALRQSGIEFNKLRIITSKSNSGGIDIIEVIVYSQESPEKIKEIIGNGNYEVTVINE